MTTFTYPSIFPRLYALFYDAILLFCICLLASIAAVACNKGQAIAPHNWPYQLYLLAICLGYPVWFWCHGGQTTGMAAWKLRIIDYTQQPISIAQAIRRLLLAVLLTLCGGITWIWIFFDKERQTLHDRLSQTKLVQRSS